MPCKYPYMNKYLVCALERIQYNQVFHSPLPKTIQERNLKWSGIVIKLQVFKIGNQHNHEINTYEKSH